MLTFIIRKLYVTLITLFGVSVIAFALVHAGPSDPVAHQLGMQYTQEQYDRLHREMGLDQPWVVQYGKWLLGAVQGDLGRSRYLGIEVSRGIREHLPVTVQLASMAMLFAVCVGIPLGLVAAVRRGRLWDYLCSSAGVAGVSVPNFWLATMLILLFSYVLGWLPSSVGRLPGLLEDPLGNLRAMIMPTLALGSAVAAVLMRMTRSSMLEVLGQDYVRTAKAKGLPPWKVVTRHALRNAMVPILTIAGVQVGYLLGGSVVVEQVFGLAGIGSLVLESAQSGDYFLLQGLILLIAVSFIAVNLAVDLLYGVLDPRMRKG